MSQPDRGYLGLVTSAPMVRQARGVSVEIPAGTKVDNTLDGQRLWVLPSAIGLTYAFPDFSYLVDLRVERHETRSA